VQPTEVSGNSGKEAKLAVQEKVTGDGQSEINMPDFDAEQTSKKNVKEKESKKSFMLFGETQFDGCHHRFGHLKGLRKNSPIPDECFGCPQILECLWAGKNKLEAE
jgi:hypothetical protein